MRGPALSVLVCTLLVGGAPRAEPGPPPDPRKGERLDARRSDHSIGNDLLAAPRILLAPPRLVFRALAEPVRGLIWLDDRHRIVDKLSRLITSSDGLRGLRPTIRYLARFSPQMGVTYFDRKALGRGSSTELTVGAVVPDLIFAEAIVRPAIPDPYRLALQATYLERDDALFAGVGLASRGGLRSNSLPFGRYHVQDIAAAATLDIKLHRNVATRLVQGWTYRDFANGRRLGAERPIAEAYCAPSIEQACLRPQVNGELVPGFHEGSHFVSTDAELYWDTRAGSRDPRYWFRLEVGARYAHAAQVHGPSWLRTRGSAAVGLPVGGSTRALVLRVAAELLEPLSEAPVPFTELVTLGGADTLRGAQLGRFRDYSSLLATLEYRWQVWMWMDAVAFTDWGGTFAPHFTDFKIDRLVPAVGAGLRIRTAHHFIMRLQVAYGWGEGVQALFSTSTGL